MQIPRRNILKRMMAGSAILAYGLPRFSFATAAEPVAPRDIVLLTAGTSGRFGLGV